MSAKETLKEREIQLSGLPASPGIAIGEACLYKREEAIVRPVKIASEDADRQFRRFTEAKEATLEELARIHKMANDEESAEIIEAQREIVNDPELETRVESLITDENYNVDYAIYEAFRSYIDIINASDNQYLKDRVIDIQSIRDRLIQITRKRSADPKIRPSSIVVTDELTPGEVVKFAAQDMKALVMDSGGLTSHTSIIAHSMGITSVVGTKRISQLIREGDTIIVDGDQGKVILRPSEETLDDYQEILKKQRKRIARQKKILKLPSVTKCGQPFTLRANMEFEEELPNLEKFQAEGIGLLRTEALYITRGHFEDSQAQERFYRNMVKSVEDHTVTIRLFDAGGDKFVERPFKEDNPFLGWRGIRMLLSERDLLREQLSAILKVAGQYPGRVKILLPMVSSLEEVLDVKEEILRVQDKMKARGLPIDHQLQLGIMVEVPSVAIQADDFAKHVDYFSVGTNDLTQYTLAVDRGNELISGLYQQTHPAVWKLIRNTMDAAERNGVGMGVCGEIASNPVAAACLIGMGIYDLSMAPASIPEVKETLISHTLRELKELTDSVESAVTYTEINQIFKEWKNQNLDS